MVSYVVSSNSLLNDLEMLLNGGFAPLNGFLGATDYQSVLKDMRLADGSPWPMPIVFRESVDVVGEWAPGKTVALLDTNHRHIANFHVEEVYVPDLHAEFEAVFGCDEEAHPYCRTVRSICDESSLRYVGGRIEATENPVLHFSFPEFRETPAQVKEWVASLSEGTPVIGIQTRNPLHSCHLELIKRAMRSAPNAKVLLQPVVGTTQPGDVPAEVRIKCYLEAVKLFPEGVVRLNLLPLSMRMAGPREAVWHALVRHNFGCTHFVVGRDHAGPSVKRADGSSFFGPLEAQDLLSSWSSEVGVTPIMVPPLYYVPSVGQFLTSDEFAEGEVTVSISGSELRRRLKAGEEIPSWFSRPAILSILSNHYRRGLCVYFVGLSGAGKSTLAEAVKELIEEEVEKPVTILDGDVIRTHLSTGLGFSREDRSTNVRRIGYVASEIVKHGGIVLVANIAPFVEDRLANRALIESEGTYVQVYVSTPIDECERRDVKGLYAKVRSGVIPNFTGISSPFEEPQAGVDMGDRDLVVSTDASLEVSAKTVFEAIRSQL